MNQTNLQDEVRRAHVARVAEDRRLVEAIREHLTELRRLHPSGSSEPLAKLIVKMRQSFDDVDAVVEEREMYFPTGE